MEWYLTCRQISHAADILNTYCQSVLADIIEVDENVWDVVRPMLPKKSRERDAAVDLLRKQDARDMKSIRELFRDELKVFWNPQIDLIVTLRNKIVHQDGFVPEAEVVPPATGADESRDPHPQPELAVARKRTGTASRRVSMGALLPGHSVAVGRCQRTVTRSPKRAVR